MALRPIGTYLLAGTALYSQTRTTVHLAEMNALAASSASLALLGDAEIEASLELQGKAAVDSEEGLVLQSESTELELEAEREMAKAAADVATGDAYAEEAELLHEKSAQDMIESEATLADAEEMQVESASLHVKAEKDRAEAALDEEKSAALLEESARAGEIAAGAEEKAAEYEAIAIRREGSSIKDGEAALKTEAGALEDAEAMAACAPIPILNIFCEALGGVIETGYQGIAAVEGAKSAVETISAAAAQRKEHAELVLAVEKQEEAARLGVEAEHFQTMADEEIAKAIVEEGESDAAIAEAGESELLGEERLEESEREEALAALDEEKATEEYAKAARDESVALEEESSAIASQIQSEELLAEGTSEEFESLAERADGEAKEIEAENIMKQSVGQGLKALWLVIHATLTAVLVVYVIFMRGMLEIAVPGLTSVFRGETQLGVALILDRLSGFILHGAILIGTISSWPALTSNLEKISAPLRVRSLFFLAVFAAVVEAIGIHATRAACSCQSKDMDARSTLATAVWACLSNLAHLIPRVLMELLTLVVIFGPGVFHGAFFLPLKPVWIWGSIASVVFILIFASTVKKAAPNESSAKEEEGAFLFSNGQTSERIDVDKECGYGSMEEVSLLSSEDCTSQSSGHATPNCFGRCKKACHRYFEGLRPSSDLLVLALMTMLLWRCSPALRVLYPLAKTSLGTISTWVSVPSLIGAGIVLAVIVHFAFVR
ncbi:hypothetical protein ACHAXT_006598 [Thalassiosira profunda]